MIKVRQMLVVPSKYSIKCPYHMEAEFITLHNTANDASANNEVAYMNRNNNQVSYHYAVDDIEVVQAVLTSRNAWHCGDGGNGKGNRKSIGVEICYSKSGGERYVKAEALAIKFVAQLLHERKWGVDRVKPHHIWSGKNCPHRIRDEGRWDDVINRIQKELNILNGEKPHIDELYHVMEKGETLYSVAKDHHVPVTELLQLNQGVDSTRIQIGQKIRLPLSKTVVKPQSKTPSNVEKPKPTPKQKWSLPTGVYKKGSKGENVKKIQRALNELKFNVGTVDGIFGAKTEDAIERFQKVYDAYHVDGVYGSRTRSKMLDLLK